MDWATIVGLALIAAGVLLIAWFVWRLGHVDELKVSGNAARVVLATFAVLGYVAVQRFVPISPSNIVLQLVAPVTAAGAGIVYLILMFRNRGSELRRFIGRNGTPVVFTVGLLVAATLVFWASDRVFDWHQVPPTAAPTSPPPTQ
jgi:hypothetical protein